MNANTCHSFGLTTDWRGDDADADIVRVQAHPECDASGWWLPPMLVPYWIRADTCAREVHAEDMARADDLGIAVVSMERCRVPAFTFADVFRTL